MQLAARILIFAAALVAGCGSSHCIVQGSLVDTPSGPRAVENLAEGDEVWTQLADGVKVPGRITRIEAHAATEYIALVLTDGTRLEVTAEHPIAARSTDAVARWTKAGTLAAGDLVRTTHGDLPILHTEIRRANTTVYDLSVSPGETFFVAGVLVHNKSRIPPAKAEELHKTWVGETEGGGLSWYRLELGPNGTGRCAVAFVDQPARLYRVTSWTLVGYDLRIVMVQADSLSPMPPKTITGTATKHSLDVVSTEGPGYGESKLVLRDALYVERRAKRTRDLLEPPEPELTR